MESLPENEVMTEELSVQLLTDDEQEQRMEMGVSDQGEGEGEGEGSERISLFDRSQNEIMKLIFAVNYRVPDEGHASFDVHAIFSTSQKIIKDSPKIIHNIIEQGSGFNDVETPKASSSFCTLINSFGCKMSCKSPGDENAFESRTEEILTKLSSYPCEVHVVLALAVFALEYEECSSQLSKKSTSLKRQDAVVELNNLVNQALQVIEHILELERLISGDRDSEPKLARVIMDTPFYAYWSIITLVACATELSLLTSDEDIKSYDLSHFSQKMGFILNKLEGQLTICQQEKAAYSHSTAESAFFSKHSNTKPALNPEGQKILRLPKRGLIRARAEAVVVLMNLSHPKQFTYTDGTPVLLDGSNKQVNIDNELKWKDMFLLLSDVGIEDCYISYLKPVYEGIRRYPSYRIVWVPVVEQWNQDNEKQLEMSRLKMPWYTLKCFPTKPGIKYMKEKWNYKGKPAVVVMTSGGMVKNENAFPLIKKHGMDAFPFFKKSGMDAFSIFKKRGMDAFPFFK